MKRIFLLTLTIWLVAALCIPASAHSGKTDASGGHYDSSTGEYHYHHGYSAHQHEDLDGDGESDCPYEFEDKRQHQSSSSYQTDSSVTNNPPSTSGASNIPWGRIVFFAFAVNVILWIIFGVLLQGSLLSQIRALKIENKHLKEQLQNKGAPNGM